MGQFKKYGFNRISKWTKNEDIFKYKMLLIPVHTQNYWLLITVDTQRKIICGYDSLNKMTNELLSMTLNYLKEGIMTKKQI